VYDHVGLRVKDLEAAKRFYRATLEALGLVQDSSGGFGPAGAPALWLHEDSQSAGGAHIAFRAKDRDAVARFHAAGLEAGGKDNGKPGLREQYSPCYFAAFLIDPDGNNVEAVCLESGK
jgi:catechol 2,3-dioxygenase-like lactoylglutathione lyase family enzyme